MDLRNNQNAKDTVQNKLKSVFSELLDCDEQYALDFADWCLYKINQNKLYNKEVDFNSQIRPLQNLSDQTSQEKLRELKAERKKTLPNNYPSSLTKGDVVLVKYGIGFCDELADKHYGIVLNRKGSMFLIAPLTSTPQPYGKYNVVLKNIGIPNEVKNGSYIKFHHIRYINYRRIEKIKGVELGKLHLTDETVTEEILENFHKMNKI